MKKSNTEEFIKKAKKVHGDKYDYSKVNYIGSKIEVTIICPEHGEFKQRPNDHLNGIGCPKCSGHVKLTTEEFIKRAREIHGDKYDYSKVNYINNHTNVIIICPEHGEFKQTPKSHLNGQGCPKCNGGVLQTTEEFIKKAKEIHGDKYDYSKVNYINSYTEVTIICSEHGEFKQKPRAHLKGYGCPKCGLEARVNKSRLTTEGFIKRAREIHGDRYDYSKVNYINAFTKVIIICPEHGEFEQKSNDHLNGSGCPSCSKNLKLTTEEFIKRAREIHGDRYDYSKTNYVNMRTKVIIICPKHGEFEQTPHGHLNGDGCPKCCSSTLENYIRSILDKYNIKYIEQKTWDWLVFINHQILDFYLPEYNCCIECQGIQHFMSVPFFDQYESFEKRLNKDSNKQKLCLEHGIRIYYFSDIIKNNISENFKYPYQVYEDFDEMFKFIKYDFNFYNSPPD